MTIIATKPSLPQRISAGEPLRIAILVVAVLAMVSVACAGWFGVSWYRVTHDKSLAVGVARDAALADAQRAMMILHTTDYQHVQDQFALWEQVTTGPLLSTLRANHDSYVRAITDSTMIGHPKMLDAAVASLDERAGSAQVLVVVDVTSQIDKGDPSCVHRRDRLDMVRSSDSWKIAMLTPVGDASPKPGPCPPAASHK